MGMRTILQESHALAQNRAVGANGMIASAGRNGLLNIGVLVLASADHVSCLPEGKTKP
jgi:hypothetical protein